MTLQTVGNKLIIQIPTNVVDILDIQDFLNFLKYKSIVSKSQATEKDIEGIVNEINDSLGKRNKNRFAK
ncbi:MAG: hypothetical protein ACPGVB_09225 [Chitinophagales bacterium]